MAREPPMGVQDSLGEIRPASVHMAAHANSILRSLNHAMFVRSANIKTYAAETNGFDRLGAVP